MLMKLGTSDFEEVFRILDKSFPEDEHRSYIKQKELLEISQYVLIGEKEDNSLVGFLAIWNFEDFVYVEHFAVSENLRNKGRGKYMLNEMLKLLNKPVVLEVEPPEDELKRRRIHFYERNGFVLNEYEYVQLAYSECRKPVPLKIMSYPVRLTQSQFIEVRNVIYKEIFGVVK